MNFKFNSNIGVRMKNWSNIVSVMLILAGGCVPPPTPLEGCTGIQLRSEDGLNISGRTLEFGIKIDSSAVVVPRGYSFTGTTPLGEGLKYQAKYGAVGSICFDNPAMMDGMNEKGLSVGTFYFPEFAGYTPVTKENQSKGLSPIEFPNWLLTQFATVDELKAGLSNAIIVPTVIKEWGPVAAPMHYLVCDKSGKSIVIEPINGKLEVFDNPVGVLTNSPNFEWHLKNLRNYINLRAENAEPLTINGVTLTSFGQGSGLMGLPGDFTPTSRFVRAAIFTVTATPSKTHEEAVFQAFHILNQFDIPVGSIRQVVDGVAHSDYTQLTCVKDPHALKYYFKSYDDQDIRFVDLTKFDLDSKELKKANMATDRNSIDFTLELK